MGKEWVRLRALVRVLGFAACCAVLAATVSAQTPTGTISGKVVDGSGLGVPGVTVTLTSPALQGTRATVTSENGDYLLPFVPPGSYTATFELSGFSTTKQSFDVAAQQTVPLNITLNPQTVSENVTVTARSDVFANTSQVATNLKADLVATLPTTRTMLAAVNLAPGVHATGPSGNTTISGAMSFDNLIMLNGVQITDNLRGTPFNLFIEDAIQETTVSTAGISAEYGRFGGGVINAITKSGGNNFSGSFRTTFTNDDWRSVSPYGEGKVNKTVPLYEYTLGGPILRDRTWFFTAGRFQNQERAGTTSVTKLNYTIGDDERRYEGKITQSLGAGHTIRGAYTNIQQTQANNSFSTILDLASLYTRKVPQDLLSLNYNGSLRPNFFVEAQYSARSFTFKNSGSQYTDLIRGTLLLDQSRANARYWSPTFCGVCDDEKRDNADILVKGTYFLSTSNTGSHNIVVGYDTFNDKRFSNNHQSGSDYRIYGSGAIVQADGTIYPVFNNGQTTYVMWNPILQGTQGTNFRTHSVFANDNWKYGTHLTVNLGLRWDKNSGKDGAGNLVAKDSALSPRFGVVWDPTGEGKWSVSGSFAKYVAAISNSIADSGSAGGQAAEYTWYYGGPAINTDPNGPLVPTDQAIQRFFDWFNAAGGENIRPFRSVALPGVNTKILGSLDSPNVREYATGLTYALGSRGTARVDYIYRDFSDFYVQRTDIGTGKVTNDLGQQFDLNVIENSNDLSRKYQALQAAASYRFGSRLTLGGNYTLSKLDGNVDGEDVSSGPITTNTLRFPEYKVASWNNPDGNLQADQRHRFRAWQTYLLPTSDRFGSVTVGFVEQMESGSPYGAKGTINPNAYINNPGYLVPPTSVDYYFTSRDAFHTESMFRTDASVNYSYRLPNHVELFALAHVLNVFNQFALYNVYQVDQTVRTRLQDTNLQAFNPFTSTPAQGTNWNYGTAFGTARAATAYTVPRQFRFAVGVRF